MSFESGPGGGAEARKANQNQSGWKHHPQGSRGFHQKKAEKNEADHRQLLGLDDAGSGDDCAEEQRQAYRPRDGDTTEEMKRILESTTRSALETEEIVAGTVAELESQHEQLDRMQRTQHATNKRIAIASHHQKAMGSTLYSIFGRRKAAEPLPSQKQEPKGFWGGIVSFFGGGGGAAAAEESTTTAGQREEAGATARGAAEVVEPSSGEGGGGPVSASRAEMNDLYAQLGASVSRTKHVAKAMGTRLEADGKQLDGIKEDSVVLNQKLKDLERKTRTYNNG